MNRTRLIGCVVATCLSLGMATQTAATGPGRPVSSRESRLAAPRPDATGQATDPSYAFYVGDWHRNPATGHWYAQLEDVSWAEAETHGVRLGGHLVTINDETEQDWLLSTFGVHAQFIGFNDISSEGTWIWSSGEPVTYTNWMSGFPNENPERNVQDVAVLGPDPTWSTGPGGGRSAALLEVPNEPTTGWISGTVTAGGSPVRGVLVEALLGEPGSSQLVSAGSATTDASGAYEIAGLPRTSDRPYRIAFRGVGQLADQYWPGERHVGAAGWVHVRAGGAESGIDATLEPAGSIAGVVTDGRGPIADIEVRAETATDDDRWIIAATAQTAQDGTYTLARLTPGAYRVLFEDPRGLVPSGMYINESLENPWLIDVGPGAIADGIDAVLRLASPPVFRLITLQVDEWHLNPASGHFYTQVENLTWPEAEAYAVRLGGHLVTINDQAEESWLGSTFGIANQFIGFNDLASDGTWIWSSGEPVTYMHYPPGQPLKDEILPEDVTNLAPDPNGDVYWADVYADGVYPAILELPGEPTTGWIAGTVLADGSPLSGISVEALVLGTGTQWVLAGSATTDASGAYEIAGLVPAEYRIVFRGATDYVDHYWGGGRSADSAKTVTLTAGGVVADVEGTLVLSGYRESGPLVSTLSTHIPTPADVSTDPPVVGANLLLAALVMILFTAAGELLNRTLAENEELLARRLRPARGLRRLRERADAALRQRIRAGRLVNVVRLAGIAAIYGLVFSLLDRTWDPLSVRGLWLFFSMAIAFGLVGIADDLACWVRARRWGVAPDLDLRTGNLVLALTSTVASRLVAIVPGIMVGMPEALQVADDRLDERQRGQLAATGLGTLVAVGGGAWVLTAGTAAALSASPDGDLRVVVGGLEAFLLIVFAVAVQNAFAQFLAFRGTPGRVLRERHRGAWFLGLLGVTFLFWHTLVNPRGDLATALQATNVLTFIATALGFTIVAVAVWAGFRVARWRGSRSGRTSGAVRLT